jgi:hypothetical protein
LPNREAVVEQAERAAPGVLADQVRDNPVDKLVDKPAASPDNPDKAASSRARPATIMAPRDPAPARQAI